MPEELELKKLNKFHLAPNFEKNTVFSSNRKYSSENAFINEKITPRFKRCIKSQVFTFTDKSIKVRLYAEYKIPSCFNSIAFITLTATELWQPFLSFFVSCATRAGYHNTG